MPNVADLYVGGIKPVASTALEANHQLAAKGPGALYDLTVLNFNATARLVLLVDASSATVPTAINASNVLLWAWPVAGLSTTPGTVGLGYFVPPIQFANGLWVVLSTTLTTPFTIVAAGADGFFSGLIQTG